jgi:SAM-dependent methyltransferase
MSTSRPIQSVSNTELYNRWAKVYDTDGNILQAIDDHLLPSLLASLSPKFPSSSALTVTELGAGTGRNTLKLLDPATSRLLIAKIHALDLSPGMLDVARERCSTSIGETGTEMPKVDFLEYDAINPSVFPAVRAIEGKADVVLSTLVLEHLPLSTFFGAAKSFLKEDRGYLVLTNMHAHMGSLSQAGFVDEETGEKIRGSSYNYEIAEVLEEAKKWGFVLEGITQEREVGEEDVGEGRLLGGRGKKWIGVKVWFGMVLSLDGVRNN